MTQRLYNRPTMPLPDVGGNGVPAGLGVAAQPVNVNPVQGNVQTEGLDLANALRGLEPGLDHYLQAQDASNVKQATEAGQVEGATAFQKDPTSALYSPAAQPSWVPPAYSKDFALGYRQSVGQANGAKSAADLLSQYQAQKNQEGFDPEQFLSNYAKTEYAGIQDPEMLKGMASHFAAAAASVRTDWNNVVQQRVRDNNESNLQTTMDSDFSPTMDPKQLIDIYQNEIVPTALKTGQFTRPELAERLVAKITQMSEANGGVPELFDALDSYPDASGMTPARSNPKLAQAVIEGRLRAEAQRDAHVADDNAAANGA